MIDTISVDGNIGAIAGGQMILEGILELWSSSWKVTLSMPNPALFLIAIKVAVVERSNYDVETLRALHSIVNMKENVRKMLVSIDKNVHVPVFDGPIQCTRQGI